MRQRETSVPQNIVEVLRFCVVAFLAGVGYQVARGFGSGRRVIGVFDAPALGIVPVSYTHLTLPTSDLV